MTPAEVRADYRNALDERGERIAMRRETVDSAIQINGLRARVTGLSPEELAAGIDQGTRKIILLAEDVEAAVSAGQWPAPAAGFSAILNDDIIVVRGAQMSIGAVDDNTRRIAGELIAYEITALG